MRPPRPAQALGLIVLLLVGAPVQAARVHAEIHGLAYPDVSAIDLHIAALDLAVDYDDGGRNETLRTRRVGIALFESLGRSSRAGLRLGRVGFDQSGRAATAGRDPAGYFVELEFSAAWPRAGRLRAALDAGWRYSSVEDSDDGGEVEVDWQTLELRPALWVALSPRVVLRLGGSVIEIDGSERVRGAARSTVNFEADAVGGGFATLEYHRGDGDVVSLRLHEGNPSGLYLAFEHRY